MLDNDIPPKKAVQSAVEHPISLLLEYYTKFVREMDYGKYTPILDIIFYPTYSEVKYPCSLRRDGSLFP